MGLDLIERRGLPIVSLTIVIGAGQAKDGERAAVARTTAQLLEAGGAGRYSSEALRQAIDGLGSNLSVVTTRDVSHLSLSVTSDKIPEALRLLSSLVRNPRFEPKEFTKLRDRELERVRSLAKTSGAWLAQYWLHRELYGQPLGIHPYASVDVLPSELMRLKVADCRRFHQEQYVPSNTRLLAVGNVDAQTLKDYAQKAFGDWTGKPAPAIGTAAPTPPEKAPITVVDRPGSSQSDVLVGFFGPERESAEFPAIVALQQIVGGGVAGRLFRDVREKRSLAYSTYASTQEVANGPTVLTLAAGTQTGKTAETLAALLENLNQMERLPGDEVELDTAKNYVIRGMPARWETVESLSSQLLLLRTLGQGDRHFDELRSAVEGLSVARLKDTAPRYYRREHAAVVIAGDAKAIAESLRDFGPVIVLDPEREFSIKQKLEVK
jgi:predicted Zn-dependent peptidase